MFLENYFLGLMSQFYLLRDVLRARAFHFNPKSRAFTSLALNSSGMLETLLNDPTEERNFLMTKSWRFSREWLRKRWNDRDEDFEEPSVPFLLEAFKFQQDWLRPFNFRKREKWYWKNLFSFRKVLDFWRENSNNSIFYIEIAFRYFDTKIKIIFLAPKFKVTSNVKGDVFLDFMTHDFLLFEYHFFFRVVSLLNS